MPKPHPPSRGALGTPLGHTSLSGAVPPHSPAHPCGVGIPGSAEFPGISSRRGTAAGVTAAADGRGALQRRPPATEPPESRCVPAWNTRVPSPRQGHSQAAGFAEGTRFIPGIRGLSRRGHPQVAADVELAGEIKENSLISEILGLFSLWRRGGNNTSPNSPRLRRI